MNVVETFSNIFKIETCKTSERMKILEVSAETTKDHIPSFDIINEFVSSLPSRDKCKISISSTIDDYLELSNKQIQKETYNNFIDQLTDYTDIINVCFSIEKEIIDNTFSIYSFENFTYELLKKNIMEIMKSFSLLLDGLDYLVFELFDSNVLFSTNTIIFKSCDQNSITKKFSRSQRLNSCKDTSYFYNSNNFELIPDDFRIETNFANNPFETLFNQIETILSLIYIASTSSIEGMVLKGQISGQRNIDFEYDISAGFDPNEVLYKIYNWIYTDGNTVDKAIIARNIISLHCKYTDLLETDEKTYASIQSNFKLYLKDNVFQYLELINKLSAFICDIVTQVGNNAMALLGNFKSNLIALFGFLFSIILVNIVSYQPLDNIFTKDITLLLELVLFVSVGYLVISVIESRYKLKKIKSGYQILKDNYVLLLDEQDINEIFKNDEIMKSVIDEVNRGIAIYTILWSAFLVVALTVLEYISKSPIIYPAIVKLYNILFR